MTHELFLKKYGEFLIGCACARQPCRTCIFKSDKISTHDGRSQCHTSMQHASVEELHVIQAHIYEDKLDIAQELAKEYGFDLYEVLQIGCEVE